MIEKVKITQEQAEAIEKYLRVECGDVAKLLDAHAEVFANEEDSWIFDYKPLNSLSQADMARALLIGYEVESEPLKVGDWALFEHGGDIWIAKIKGIRPARLGKKLYLPDNEIHQLDGDRYYANVEKADEVSLIKVEKERRVWAKLGRQVGEFKKGDVGRSHNGSTTAGVSNIEAWYVTGHLKGFFPVESFISFEDGDDQ